MPGEDVHENAGGEAPQPSAPDPSKMDQVSGYNNVGFNNNAGECCLQITLLLSPTTQSISSADSFTGPFTD